MAPVPSFVAQDQKKKKTAKFGVFLLCNFGTGLCDGGLKVI